MAIRVVNTRRLVNSRNGIPRYSVALSDGTVYTTKADADVNFGITNSEYHENDIGIRLEKGEIVDVWVVKDKRKCSGIR